MLLVVLFLVLGLVSSASAQLPAGWSQADIGGPSPAGSASYDQATGTWTVTGDGADIWETSDSFHFVFRRLKGDGMMTARVVSIAGAGLHEWAKAGVMIRETLNANSRNAMTAMTPGRTQNHAAQFTWRATTGGFSDQSSGGSMSLPYWVRIQRMGNTLRGYISPNGSTWTRQGTDLTISMSQEVYIGLVVLSHVAGQLNTDRFDNVAIQGELIEEVPAKAITYQGRLLDGDIAADGLYDLQFSLYDAPTGGSQTGSTVAIEDMDVIEGYFTVDLDFGEGVFDGNPRWLQIAVRPGAGTGSLTVLDPRQRIAPTPYALYAFSGAGGGGGGVTAPLVLSGSVANPGAIIKGTNTGNGIGLYGEGETAGVWGDNSSSGSVGMLGGPIWGVYGISSDMGLYGQGLTAGVYGSNSSSGSNFGALGGPTYGVYGSSTFGLAGLFDGTVQITGGSPGAGKVLTSDAAGLASWQTPTGGGGGDNLGNHTATQNINLNGHYLSGDGASKGIYVNSFGRVGIGTSSPGYDLDVAGVITATGTAGQATAQIKGATEGNGYGVAGYSSYGYGVHGSGGSVGVSGYTDSGTGVGVAGYSNSSIGVEGYSPSGHGVEGYSSSGYAGYFDGKSYFSKPLEIGATGAALLVKGAEAIWYDGTCFSWGFGGQRNYFARPVSIGTTDPGGYALYVSGTAFSTGFWLSSDARFKKDVRQIDSALDKVMDLHGVSFEWDSSSNPDKQFPQGRHYGVIAQEVEQVVPEVVMEGTQGEKAVSYTELVPILIEAVKELKAENDALKQRLDILERKADQTQSAITKEVQP
jgi:hypothetical protein